MAGVENKYKIQVEQLKLLRQHMVFMLITTSIVASVVSYALWDRLNHIHLLTWLSAIYLISLIRFIDWLVFWKNMVTETSIRGRIILLTVFSGISGCIWGSAGLVFLSMEDIYVALFFSMVLPAMVSGSVASLSVLQPAFFAFATTSLLLISYRLFSFDDRMFTAVGFLTLMFLFANLVFARTINRSIVETIKLRFKNDDLLEKFKQQKERADLARQKAEQASIAKSRFLAAASHDLRQPLHALSLFIDALKDTNTEAGRSRIFPKIDTSLEALRKLFDALLDVSRLDAKVVKPESTHFDLSKLLITLKEEFESAANNKKIEIRVHSNKAVVFSDRLLLERVLRNLVSNAIRYTRSGSVLLSTRLRGEEILLQVWDTGVGIPPESRSEVFVEFQQLHNKHRDREQGLGLGLALVRRICDLLGHSLSLDSRLDIGSVFSIRVPQGEPSLIIDKKVESVSHSWDLDGCKVLVIDDEREILQAMKTLLTKWGCHVFTADSLPAAIAILKAGDIKPELILSDLRLRDDSTGIEALDGIREYLGFSIPGILITGDTDPERIKLVKQSDYELLQKPVRPAHLRSVINHHLAVEVIEPVINI